MSLHSLPSYVKESLELLLQGQDARSLRQASEALSASYRRKQPGQPHLQPEQSIKAYLAARLPATYAVNAAVIKELQRLAPDFAPTRLLELGAGPGTATLAAVASFTSLEKLVLVELEQSMIQVGKTLFAAGNSAQQQARWLAQSLPAIPSQPTDLVLMSYVINELGPARRQALYTNLKQLAPEVIVAIEPGTPEGSAHLLDMRQFFLDNGWQIWAPCPHAQACPLQAPDWCHFAQRLERSSLQRYLKQGSQNFEDEKFAYLILSRSAVPQPIQARILRHPQLRKGHLELNLCTPEGNQKLTVSKSEDSYRKARKASWGEQWEKV
jgi:ribosomal protein RSM22 (predicted rRNA methylase)